MDSANYIIDNKMRRVRKYQDINKEEFSKYYILKLDDQPITEVYRRINKY